MVHCLLCSLTTPWQYNIISETLHLSRWSYCLGFPQSLTAASNPEKGQGLPHSGFTETCVWSISRSSFSVIPEVITQDPERYHALWVLKGIHTPLCADGHCVILLFPHQDLRRITCVWTTLFQAVPDFCSESAAYSSPSRTNSQTPGFLLKASDSYNF